MQPALKRIPSRKIYRRIWHRRAHCLATVIVLVSILSFGLDEVIAQSLDLTVNEAGVSFGDSEEIIGLRFNYRDRNLRRVTGINTTIWTPHDPARGLVIGVALGAPVTGARELRGMGLGILGVGTKEDATGFMASFIGVGAGEDLRGVGYGGIGAGAGRDAFGVVIGGLGAGAGRDALGVMFGGLGAGAGNDATGLMFGGLGAGAGNNATGLMFGGLGAGAGNDATGLMFGGLGAGAGKDATGLMIGGLGAGAGQDATGIMIGGLGAGAGRDVHGLMLGLLGGGAGRDFYGVSMFGIGVGAGHKLSGAHMAIGGVGAPEIEGFAAALAVGGENVTGAIFAPAYFKVEENGVFRGVSVSAFNRIQGEQRGVTIGILNWTHHLNGLQIGLLNFAGNKDKFRWLPFFNYHKD